MILTTVPDSKTAQSLARSLVQKRLAACVNVCENAQSYYRWKGKLKKSHESLLLIKTLGVNFEKIQKHLKAVHPYELPELIGLPVQRVSKAYLAWIKKSIFGVLGIMLFAATAMAAPLPAETITPEELRNLQLQNADFVLWDARDKASFETMHIQGAALPLSETFYNKSELYAKGLSPEQPDPLVALKEATENLDKTKLIVTYCNRNCSASRMLLEQLQGLGFTNVKSMEAGLQEWEEKGYPVVIGVPKLKSNSL